MHCWTIRSRIPRKSADSWKQPRRFLENVEWWNFLVEAEASEPVISKMHPNILNQAALAGDSVQIANQQNSKQNFWIDRRPPCMAVARLQGLTAEAEIDLAINEA